MTLVFLLYILCERILFLILDDGKTCNKLCHPVFQKCQVKLVRTFFLHFPTKTASANKMQKICVVK